MIISATVLAEVLIKHMPTESVFKEEVWSHLHGSLEMSIVRKGGVFLRSQMQERSSLAVQRRRESAAR